MSKVQCTLCNDIIESKHQHDFQQCSCEETAVDGGNDYPRVLFKTSYPLILTKDENEEE